MATRTYAAKSKAAKTIPAGQQTGDAEMRVLLLRVQRLGEVCGLLAAWRADPRDYLTARYGDEATEARDWVCAVIAEALAKETEKTQRKIERHEAANKRRLTA